MRLAGLDDPTRAALADHLEGLVRVAIEQAATAGARALSVDGPPTAVDLAAVTSHFTAALDQTIMTALADCWATGEAHLRLAAGDLDVVDVTAAAVTAAAWVPPPPAGELARNYLAAARNRLVGIADAVWAATRQALVDGIDAREGPPQLATRVADAAEVPMARAVAIARTEALGAASGGEMAQLRALGWATTKTWLSAHDSRVRPTHVAADGQTRPLADPYLVGGWPMDRPHDPAGPPEETIQCRCSQTFAVDPGPSPPTTPARRARSRERDKATVAQARAAGATAARGAGSRAVRSAATADRTRPPEGEGEDAMPWEVRDDQPGCDGWAVVQTETDETAGCHDSEAAAQAQLRALYAEAEEGEGEAASLDLHHNHVHWVWGASPPASGTPTAGTSAGRYTATLALEDTPTREAPAREFRGGALTWVDPPFPLKWQEAEAPGHEGAVIVGRVDRAWREGARIRGEIVFDLDGTHGAEAHRLLAGQFLRGGSLLADDIADPDVELVYADLPELPDDDGPAVIELLGPPPERVVFHAGRIRSWTLVAEPAFAEALVDVPAGELAQPSGAEALAAAASFEVDNSAWDGNAAMAQCEDAACYRAICAGRRAGPPDQRGTWALPHHKTAGGPPNAAGVRNALAQLPKTQGLTNTDAARSHLERHLGAINASALVATAATITIPDLPPVEWFERPPVPTIRGGVTITPEGRLYGFLAPRGMAHRGFDAIIETPMGTVDYAAFMNKPAFAVDATGEAVQLAAGNITMACGHAPPRRPNERVGPDHYDNSCSVAARIRIGEDDHGVWVAGALLPDVDADQVSRMLACELSGDWEPHRTRPGWHKFVAAHLVPVGGLPSEQPDDTVRVRFRDGALVASSVPVHLGSDPEPVDELAAGRQRRELADLIAAGVGLDQASRRRALALIMHPAGGGPHA